jgi:hypothetical protein
VRRIVYQAVGAPVYYTCSGLVYGPRILVRVTGARSAKVQLAPPEIPSETLGGEELLEAPPPTEQREPLPLPLAPQLKQWPSYTMLHGL